jgi:regulator of protease activity HflC (stomatin/prohibitin superfamily)
MELLTAIDPRIAAGIATAVVLAGVVLSVRRVPQGFEFCLERFGRFRRILAPGAHLVLPIADRVGARHDMRERSIELPRAEMLGRDRVPVEVDAVAFFQVVDAARASYEVEDLIASLRALLAVSLRTLVGERSLDELLAGRTELNAALLAAVDDAAAVWGVRMTRTEVGELRPPAALVEAVQAELEAELVRRTRVREAEGERRARQLRSDSEREAELALARTRSEVAALDAESAERVAEGDARATLMLSRALEQGSVHALNYLLARQYVDALKTLADSDNARFVILPLENGGVAASLTGIRELAEATFPEGPDPVAGDEAPSPDDACDAAGGPAAPDEVAESLVPDPVASAGPGPRTDSGVV